MWIKICANTNLEDALLAAELGADAVGFVFAPSKRQVSGVQVAAITRHLPAGVEKVGVFLPGSADEIAETVRLAGLDAVQLHGGVDLEFARRLVSVLDPAIEIVLTTHWEVGSDSASGLAVAQAMAALAEDPKDYRLLIDSKVSGASGGTGIAFDWGEARSVLQSQPALRVIVAGGLNPENVGAAIHELKPWGVDVASGVEERPGLKSLERLKRFIEATRAAGADL